MTSPLGRGVVRRLACLVLGLVVGASVGRATAQNAAPHSAEANAETKAAARAAFKAGVAAMKGGAWEAALRDFARSYALVPHPLTLLNLAACQAETGRVDEAIRAYRRFLNETRGTDTPAELRSGGRHALRDLEARSEAPAASQPPSAPADGLTGAPPVVAAAPTDSTEVPTASTEAPAAALHVTAPPTPTEAWYESPWLWAGGAVAVAAGVILVVTLSGGARAETRGNVSPAGRLP